MHVIPKELLYVHLRLTDEFKKGHTKVNVKFLEDVDVVNMPVRLQ